MRFYCTIDRKWIDEVLRGENLFWGHLAKVDEGDVVERFFDNKYCLVLPVTVEHQREFSEEEQFWNHHPWILFWLDEEEIPV